VDSLIRPGGRARLSLTDGSLAVLGYLFVGVGIYVHHHAVAVPMQRLGHTNRNLIVNHAYELVLENQMLRIFADLQGIERVVGSLRQRDPRNREGNCYRDENSEYYLHGFPVYVL